jgi:hypothetical protein
LTPLSNLKPEENMTPLELKKLKAQQAQVAAARMDLEVRVDEHKENIDRLEASIAIQIAKEAELGQKIKEEESK